jgi:hypothetical protein
MLTFYHGLSKEKWLKTIEKGYLLHDRKSKEYPNASSVVYLTTTKKEAMCYGEVLLEVKYNPFKNPKLNNYQNDCWQLRVYEQIELSNIKKI